MFTLAEIVLKRIFYLGTKIYDDFLSAFSMNPKTCLLYTSDAADDGESVDLGGRRIIKKKKRYEKDHEKTQK